MKIIAILVGLFLVAGPGHAQTTTTTKTPPPAKTPPKKSAPAKTPPPKKEEPPPKIEGYEIARANGTFLGLQIVETRFKLSFYDAKKKPMAVDVTRAVARWDNKRSGTPSDYRTVLNPEGTALVAVQPVFPPFAFNVYLTLLEGEGDGARAVETFVIPFRG